MAGRVEPDGSKTRPDARVRQDRRGSFTDPRRVRPMAEVSLTSEQVEPITFDQRQTNRIPAVNQ